MRHIIPNHFILPAISCLLILASCATSDETIVIEDAPTSSEPSDTTRQTAEPTGTFQQLTIGENQPIRSFDPLFVENASGMRAIQLLYEGLVRYNEEGEISPAIAKDWMVSNNERTYRFTLNKDLYYHDSDIFSAGRGRRLVAADVKKVFERMAKVSVPDRAAQLFMDIRGFEPYYREQHDVIMPGDRRLDGVNGIRTPNDSTVVFSLVESDPQFLQKLATPYAVIYPSETTADNGFKAVGTGPFKLSQQRSDSLYIFSQFDNYRNANQPRLNRVDIAISGSERALLKALAQGDVQLIPELGPEQQQKLLSDGDRLTGNFAGDYTLYGNQRMSGYFLRYNTGADIPKNAVTSALSLVRKNDFSPELTAENFNIRWTFSGDTSQITADTLTSTYTEDPFLRAFYAQLAEQLAENNIEFIMGSTRVRNRNTPLYSENYLPIGDSPWKSGPENTLAVIEVKSPAVARNNIENLGFNNFPWWIDLREVTLTSTDSL